MRQPASWTLIKTLRLVTVALFAVASCTENDGGLDEPGIQDPAAQASAPEHPAPEPAPELAEQPAPQQTTNVTAYSEAADPASDGSASAGVVAIETPAVVVPSSYTEPGRDRSRLLRPDMPDRGSPPAGDGPDGSPCPPTCLPTFFNYGCLKLFSTTPTVLADYSNVPMGAVYAPDYRALTPSTPDTAWSDTALLHLKQEGMATVLLQSVFWCCPDPTPVCINCITCDLSWLSDPDNFGAVWPDDYFFTMPSVQAGWYDLTIDHKSPLFIHLTYPNTSDLAVATFDVPATAVAGSTAITSFIVVNNGELGSGTITSRVYMSDDAIVDATDVLLGQTTHASIAGGQQTTLVQSVSIPSTVQGLKYFKVHVTGTVGTEVATIDNWSPLDAIFFQPDIRFAGANLVWVDPIEPSGPPLLLPEDPFEFYFEYENAGNADTAPTTEVEVHVADNALGLNPVLIDTLQLTNPVISGASGVLTSPNYVVTLPPTLSMPIGTSGWVFLRFVNAGAESTTLNNDSIKVQFLYSAKLELVLHKPLSMSDTEEERADGAVGMVWFNIDNDDNDDFWDFDVDDPTASDLQVLGGDNDMARIKLKLQPNDPAVHTGLSLSMNIPNGTGHIVIWDTHEKGQKYSLGSPIPIPTTVPGSGWTVDGEWLVRDAWIEGIKPHTPADPDTEIELAYSSSACINNLDTESIYVLGIDDLTVIGQGNGFGPPTHTSSTLDADPAWDGTGVPAVRLFPGGRAPTFTTPRNRVAVVIRLSRAPAWKQNVTIASWDVDDPSTDTSLVDPNDTGTGGNYSYTMPPLTYTADEDNRGEVQGDKDGYLVYEDFGGSEVGESPSGLVELQFEPAAQVRTCFLETSLMAGDNYRVAVGYDDDMLLWQNFDADHGHRVVDPGRWVLTGDPDQSEVQFPVTPVINVWRILHIEMDTMRRPQGTENHFTGEFTHFVGVGGLMSDTLGMLWPVSLAPLEFVLDPARPLWDGSPNLNTPHPHTLSGQWENGILSVGSKDVPVEANGDDYVQFLVSQDFLPLGFRLDYTSGGNPEWATGLVTLLGYDGPSSSYGYVLDIQDDSGVVSWPDFVGGSMSIEGGSAVSVVGQFQPYSLIVTQQLRIPFELHDDDDDSQLAGLNPQLSPMDLTDTASIYRQVYILPELDGGSDMLNNQESADFDSHVEVAEMPPLGNLQDTPSSADTFEFWVAHVVLAHQLKESATTEDPDRPFKLDWDPRNPAGVQFWDPAPGPEKIIVEGAFMGATPFFSGAFFQHPSGPIGTGSWGQFVFVETIRDWGAFPGWSLPMDPLEMTVAHELGHQLGLTHFNAPGLVELTTTLMAGEAQQKTMDFNEFQQHVLRCRTTGL